MRSWMVLALLGLVSLSVSCGDDISVHYDESIISTITGACNIASGKGTQVFFNEQPPYGRDVRQRMHLVNNEKASDLNWDKLREFIVTNRVDEKPYDASNFPYWSYAEELHNSAEEAGIRCAVVVIDFTTEVGKHALNAFYTTDCGIVFIDCTGEEPVTQQQLTILAETYGMGKGGHDKVAYVYIGKSYGVVSVSNMYGNEYTAYEAWLHDFESFETKFKEYEDIVGVFRPPGGYLTLLSETEYERTEQLKRRSCQ